jgi:hypothetical protein
MTSASRLSGSPFSSARPSTRASSEPGNAPSAPSSPSARARGGGGAGARGGPDGTVGGAAARGAARLCGSIRGRRLDARRAGAHCARGRVPPRHLRRTQPARRHVRPRHTRRAPASPLAAQPHRALPARAPPPAHPPPTHPPARPPAPPASVQSLSKRHASHCVPSCMFGAPSSATKAPRYSAQHAATSGLRLTWGRQRAVGRRGGRWAVGRRVFAAGSGLWAVGRRGTWRGGGHEGVGMRHEA